VWVVSYFYFKLTGLGAANVVVTVGSVFNLRGHVLGTRWHDGAVNAQVNVQLG
jgi:hypothetical protein